MIFLNWSEQPGLQSFVMSPADRDPFMQEFLDNLSDALFIVDHAWRLTYTNHMAEACWGCRREDVLGQVFWERFPDTARMPCRSKYETSMNERIPVQWETELPALKLWVDIRTHPTIDGGLAVFFSDISEKKRAEDVLRLSRDRQALLLSLSDSLRLLTSPYDIQEAAARVLGSYLGVETAFYCDVVTVDGAEYFSVENIYSTSDNHLEPGLHSIDSPGVLAKENHEGRNIVVCDMETDPRIGDDLRPELRELRLGAWVSVPLIRNGRFVASFTVHQPSPRAWTPEEISLIEEATARIWAEVDRVRAETALRISEQNALRLVSELENADRNKNEFINALSHELRNPLAAIVASLSMLDIIDRNPNTRKQRAVIRRQTDQLSRMVDDLLDTTRIANNKIQLNKELVDLGELARSCCFDYRTLFEEKSIDLVEDICDEPLYITADPVRISQIIDNLLHNACKFTGYGGKATLAAYSLETVAMIVVSDDGIGIDQAFLPELFKTFRQADHHRGGLGLGLSIVKGIVELHGGSVAADSGGLTKGATFSVSLPLAAEPATSPSDGQSKTVSAVKPLRILLIDDNRDLVETSSKLLTLFGYTVTAAFSGTDGIDKAKRFQPNIVICDIGLPDMDGYEVARRISANKKLPRCRLISMSGYAQDSDIEYSSAAGFALHIRKPVDFENLKVILESMAR
jgi:PAS domain S-box-containing protein